MYRGHYSPLESRLTQLVPPTAFTDATGREIELRPYGDGPVGDERDALVALYQRFDSSDRTMGVPPRGEERIREWQDALLEGYCIVAWHDQRAVGQAVLVPDGEGRHELAIFLEHAYQGAGIGTRLTEALLIYGRKRGVESVWLVVERENTPAVQLYRDVGFAVTEESGYDLEMALTM